MKLVTIIVNYKTADMTLDAATAAIKQLQIIDAKTKLVIVDNDSRDGSFETLQAAVAHHIAESDDYWQNVSVVSSAKNGGFGAGNNIAMQAFMQGDAPPDYFYILNSDAFPEAQSIALLIKQLDENPVVGITGSYIHGEDQVPHITAFRFPTIFSELEGSIQLGLITKLLKQYSVPMGIPQKTQQVDWLAGASMMLRRDMLEQIGLFDERYFLYFEETDLCHRAKNAGWATVYVLESSVSHIGSVSTGMRKWQKIPEYWLDSRRRYFSQRYGKAYYRVATLVRIFGELVWRLRVKLEGKPDTMPSGFVYDLARHFFFGKQKK